MRTFLEIWAAFGLLFVGVKMVGSHVQELAGGHLREQIRRTLDRAFAPQLLGMLSGAVTQSSAAVAVAAAGLISTSGVSLARVLPLLPWANVGTTLLLLALALDMRGVILFVFGLVGLATMLRMDRRDWVRQLLGALLGLALLLFATSMLRGAVGPLRGDPGVSAVMLQVADSWLWGVGIGLLAGILTQSSLIVTIMALPLVQAGFLTLEDVAPIVYGAFLGTGIGQMLLLSSGANAAVRRLMLSNLALRVMTFVLLIVELEIETADGMIGALDWAVRLSEDPGTQLGLLYLFVQLVMALLCEMVKHPLVAWITRLVPTPPPASKPWMQPAYLFDGGIEVPDTAVDLARREQLRLFRLLPSCLDDLRDPAERAADYLPFAPRHEGNVAVAQHIDGFLNKVLHAHPGMAGMDRLFLLRRLSASLQSCNELVGEFVRNVQSVPEAERPPLIGHMTEALHLVLETAADALEQPDDEHEHQMLRELTAERGASLDMVRKALLQASQTFEGREALLNATLDFERLLWVLHHMPVSALRGDARAGTTAGI
jgi:phosphate:Na+ symporter